MKKIRWGILGCADIVERRMLPAMEGAENAELVAIASRGKSDRLQRVCARYKPDKVYESYEQLLEDECVDAVYIPLPNALHAEWTIRAAEHKKHVLCEKPLACTVEDVDRIAAAAKESSVLVMEAFACMHSPLYPTLRGLIQAGEIGEPRLVETIFCYHLANAQNINASRELEGGSINDVGCYNLLTIRQLTNKEPRSATAMATFLPSGVDATVAAVLDMGDGLFALSRTSLQSASRRDIYVTGSEGHLNFPKTPNTWGDLAVTLATPNNSKTIALHTRNTYTLELEQFGRCILGGESPMMPLGESRKNIQALEMLRAAAYGQKTQ